MSGILVTSDGSHSGDQWAVIVAEHIFPVNPAVEGDRLLAARRVQNAMVEVLAPHFANHKDRECEMLTNGGDERLAGDYDSSEAADAALADCLACLNDTPWAAKAEDPEYVRIMRGELLCQLNTVQNIERQWHCHRNQTAGTDSFLAQHNITRV